MIAGIEFDQDGRYNGNVGTSAQATAFNDTDYVGNPAVASVQVDWATTGPTDPANIIIDLGEAGTFNGLTGFGSASQRWQLIKMVLPMVS